MEHQDADGLSFTLPLFQPSLLVWKEQETFEG